MRLWDMTFKDCLHNYLCMYPTQVILKICISTNVAKEIKLKQKLVSRSRYQKVYFTLNILHIYAYHSDIYIFASSNFP